MNRRIVWFSCGAASAYLAKLSTDAIVVYCDTGNDEHPDNRRFLVDVESWIERPIIKISSDEYSGVDDVIRRTRYISGPKGARCTTELKKLPREKFQEETDTHLFGYTCEETKRASEFEDRNPSISVEWPLIDMGISKLQCLDAIKNAGIELPAMYKLGFEHNNCIGCLKSSSSGYWNKIRIHFPDVFNKRAKQSRLLGVKLVRSQYTGKRIYLDVLQPDDNSLQDDIDCGPVCQKDEESA